jgi:hypothetical protein
MKEDSKIRLSKKEVSILEEEKFFHGKRSVTEKVFLLLSEVVKEIQSVPEFQGIIFPRGTDITSGKISKGENYLGLPFIILDFPRLFNGDEILTFRTMLWWGNFISCSLLISGTHLPQSLENLNAHYESLSAKKNFVCVNESPWIHHFESNNFVKLATMNAATAIQLSSLHGFVKVSRKIPVSRINRLVEFASESFVLFSKLLL